MYCAYRRGTVACIFWLILKRDRYVVLAHKGLSLFSPVYSSWWHEQSVTRSLRMMSHPVFGEQGRIHKSLLKMLRFIKLIDVVAVWYPRNAPETHLLGEKSQDFVEILGFFEFYFIRQYTTWLVSKIYLGYFWEYSVFTNNFFVIFLLGDCSNCSIYVLFFCFCFKLKS